jgi:hypothetical protein
MQGLILPDNTPAYLCCRASLWAQRELQAKLAWAVMDDTKIRQLFPDWDNS